MSKLFSWTVTSIDSNLILTMERISLRGKWNGDWSNIEILYRNWFRWNNSMSNIDDHAVYLRFIRSWRNMQKIFASYYTLFFFFYNDIKLKRHRKYGDFKDHRPFNSNWSTLAYSYFSTTGYFQEKSKIVSTRFYFVFEDWMNF